MITTMGLDLGIKTGSLVQVEVDPDYNLITRHRVLVSWTAGPSIKDSLEQGILKFFDQHVFPWVQFEYAESLAVDWDISDVYWGSNKKHSAIKTFIAGYLTAKAHNRSIYTRFILPNEVRTFFGMPSKLSKNDLQRHFLSMPLLYDPNKRKGQFHNHRTDHDLDAVILAYVLALKLRGQHCPEMYRWEPRRGNGSCKVK